MADKKLLRCKHCNSIPNLIARDVYDENDPDIDNWTFIRTDYWVECQYADCYSRTAIHVTEEDAIEEWNREYGQHGVDLESVIHLRGVDKPDYDSAGIPEDNYWTAYYNGWRDAYKDLKEIVEQNRPDLLSEIIVIITMGLNEDKEKNDN